MKSSTLTTFAGITVAAAAGWLLWGNNSIEVTRITIPHTAVPHAFDGFRIAHITDFHNTTFGKDHHRLLNALRKANPDLIAITGDMIDARRTDIPQALSFAEEIVKIAPCYYVMGNHEARIPDFPVFEKGLRECGVHVLRNESVCLEREGEYVTVIGLDDPAASEHFTETLLQLQRDARGFTLLLSHRPERFNSYWSAGIPLSELEAEGHHEVIVKDYYQVPVQPSYLNYSNGILWVGNFYHADENSYKAPSTLGKTKADNDDERFGGYLLGYDLTEKGAQRMVPAEGEDYAMPDADKLYATVDRIQGMTMLEDGTIILSRSYGRTANSQLMVHDPAKAVTKKVSLGDVEYDCIMLEKSTCLDKEYTMLPMSEGITVKADGNGREILVLSESGSVIFDGDGTYDTKTGIFRTDYIWKVEVPEME